MVGGEQIIALKLRNHPGKLLPVVRENAIGTIPVKPVEITLPTEENAAQNHRRHIVRVGLGIEETESRSPGTTKQNPFVDAEKFADSLDVFDQVGTGVFPQLTMWC